MSIFCGLNVNVGQSGYSGWLKNCRKGMQYSPYLLIHTNSISIFVLKPGNVPDLTYCSTVWKCTVYRVLDFHLNFCYLG